MRIGWRTFLKQKFQSKSPFHSIGIAIGQEAVTFCLLNKVDGALTLEREETVSLGQWREQLSQWVDKFKLGGTPCHVAFTMGYYQLLQVERPPVEDNELHAALAWPVKELVGSEEELVFDYLDLPVSLAGSKKVNLAALPRQQVEDASEAVFHAGLKLKGISVAEIALCELVGLEAEPVLTLIQEAGEEISLNIVKDGQLYVSRRLKGFENLGSFSEQELQMGIADSLSVQVQRSMDYFESQLRQPPVRQIRLKVDTQQPDVLANLITQVVNASVSVLQPNVQAQAGVDISRANAVALGAALGEDAAVAHVTSTEESAQ